MAVGFVNGINSTTAQSSLATSWSVTAGNLLLVCVYDDTGSLRNVSSDSQGNTYTLVGSAGGYNCAQSVYACIAGSSGVVTVNMTGAADVIAISEWSGVQLVADAALHQQRREPGHQHLFHHGANGRRSDYRFHQHQLLRQRRVYGDRDERRVLPGPWPVRGASSVGRLGRPARSRLTPSSPPGATTPWW